MNKLSNEFKVALQILDLKNPNFSELVKILDGRLTRNEISTSLDILYDLGLIKENYTIKEKICRREIYLTDEAKILFTKIMEEVKISGE